MPANDRKAGRGERPLRGLRVVFVAGHLLVSALFIVCAAALIAAAVYELWQAIATVARTASRDRINSVLDALAVLTIALAALQLGQTIIEEEVQREVNMSAPTRVRRFLSRFMIVLVVALAIETLVLTFRLGHEAPEQLPFAAAIGAAAAALLVAWGAFVRFNRDAEMLEPDAIERAKREDRKVE
jgi:hypothetical protein